MEETGQTTRRVMLRTLTSHQITSSDRTHQPAVTQRKNRVSSVPSFDCVAYEVISLSTLYHSFHTRVRFLSYCTIYYGFLIWSLPYLERTPRFTCAFALTM